MYADILRFIEIKDIAGKVILLRNIQVLMWVFGDLSFLTSEERKTKKQMEDEWGRSVMKTLRPDLKLDKQWTNLFGEQICEELYILKGKTVTKPPKKENKCPDRETEDEMLEAKAGTFNTTGTAGEKILGTPFKYADIPILQEKPLKIVCIGFSEKECREKQGNLPGVKCSERKSQFIEFQKSMGIEQIAATDILKSLV